MDGHVFSFGEGKARGYEAIAGPEERRRILGGKGAGLAEMTAAGLPVPPGFTISTAACILWQREGRLPASIEREIDEALALLERRMGKRLGDPANPLLVSVRSGAPKSMPGMMDTILNLGLDEQTVEGLVERTGNARFAYDAWRRFVSMFGEIVLGVPRAGFEAILREVRAAHGAAEDHELDAETLRREVVPAFLAHVERTTGAPFPRDARAQLDLARDAIFRSWNNPRAVEYRRRFHIPDDLGTAVNVQAMVFGNMGETSATGVGFTRDPATGAKTFFGEWLPNAQGEDVVAGIRTPRPIAALQEAMPDAFAQLRAIAARLEAHYRWPQDFEFTIEEGRLYMLQTRDAKCTARAALRWACDLLDAGILTEEEALLRIDPGTLDQLLHPVFDARALAGEKPACTGLPAGPGAATGRAVFTAAEAVRQARAGQRVILVRAETCPDDIAGMIAAQGVLTATGGMTSHAAVVGRQLGKPCVVGAGAIAIDERRGEARVGERRIRAGDPISIDGTTGAVYLTEIPTVPSDVAAWVEGRVGPEASQTLRDWIRLLEIADRHRTLEVHANADQPRDARAATRLGAQGIGLCRTEHMFFEGDRIAIVQRMILAAADGREGLARLEAARARRARAGKRRADPAIAEEIRAIEARYGAAIAAYQGALDELLPLQRADFHALFKEMGGRPVVVRLLDPPLHEFLPKREELLVAREALRHGRTPEGWSRLEKSLKALLPAFGGKRLGRKALVEAVLRRVEELHEFNPMLGHRGCRVGITWPEITAMQARAIFEAAARCIRNGIPARPKILIPLVGTVRELVEQKRIVARVHAEVQAKKKVEIPLSVGTMIEVPRAALVAGAIAAEADFFSFGTNDLTQMTWGYSRDDVGRFLPGYLAERILPHDPFATLDGEGVGRLLRIAVEEGRAAAPGLEIGVCGEHGGDPASIERCHELGLRYVSCSPWRIPVARLSAAHAALRARRAAALAPPRRAAAAVATGPELPPVAPELLRVAELPRGGPGNALGGRAGELEEGPGSP